MLETIIVKNKKEMISLAERFASVFKSGDIVALYGNLGVGKTFFVQNACKFMQVHEDVSSPSYVLLNQYNGKFPIHHYDLYRLQFPEEVFELGILENAPNSVTFIEWPEIASHILPVYTYHFYFDYLSSNKRQIVIKYNSGD
jgi:tRNA threonylcarbamoyladenosine biosynthesis protein TsaE